MGPALFRAMGRQVDGVSTFSWRWVEENWMVNGP